MFRTDNIQELLLFLTDFNSDTFVSFKYRNVEIINSFFIGIVNNNIIIDHGIHRTYDSRFSNYQFEDSYSLVPNIKELDLIYSKFGHLFELRDAYLIAKEDKQFLIYHVNSNGCQHIVRDSIDSFTRLTGNLLYYRNITRIPIQN